MCKKVSIIIPVYQTEKFLDKCIDSILSQTFLNIEVLIIDDGSTDRGPYICDVYAKSDERIRVIHKRNEGVSTARNLGIRCASGDYIAFVDSDDWLDSKFIENSVSIMEADEKVDIVFTDYFEYSDEMIRRNYFDYNCTHIFEKNRTRRNSIDYLRQSMLYPRLAPMKNSRYTVGVPWGKVYRNNFLLEHNLQFDTDLVLNEDVIFNLKAFGYARKIAYLPSPLYYYRISGESSMNKIDSKINNAIDVRINLIEKYEAFEEIHEIKVAAIGKQAQLINQCNAIKESPMVSHDKKEEITKLTERIMLKCRMHPKLWIQIVQNYKLKWKWQRKSGV